MILKVHDNIKQSIVEVGLRQNDDESIDVMIYTNVPLCTVATLRTDGTLYVPRKSYLIAEELKELGISLDNLQRIRVCLE